ncbi:protocatechuate 3,4-dioxygenase subunit beta [Leifsonia sp. AG29]|uniref:protocatechuate 3,4-dioxygenase subunit beta n=1 Tax=Leifsonia sp. AG29 TaxID=2598860 RepID=UPI00131A9C95|nr:protocatechuate 3,4-dioxygenase subunit beta [Leifsonia sp. AG29]
MNQNSEAELTQAEISAEIAEAHEAARTADGQLPPHPLRDFRPYRSSALRHPTHELVRADPEEIELVSPAFGHSDVGAEESDLTIQHTGEPLGERIIVTGRVLDGEGRPVTGQLIEIWQANSAGRYVHKRDQHPAPLDPNFTGVGRAITGDDGSYRFVTIKPGPYPWKNHRNAWRPAHIHFSLFGNAFTQRLVTQMYFPSDPLFALDPIYQSIVDPEARKRLIAAYDHELSVPEWAMGYRWDIVLTGGKATWMEPEEGEHA